jgi:hypothetical protein
VDNYHSPAAALIHKEPRGSLPKQEGCRKDATLWLQARGIAAHIKCVRIKCAANLPIVVPRRLAFRRNASEQHEIVAMDHLGAPFHAENERDIGR